MRTGARIEEALIALAQERCEIVAHHERAWSSATFSGTRHRITLRFHGAPDAALGEAMLDAWPLPIEVPGQLIADASVVEVEHRCGPMPALTFTAELLLLDDSRGVTS